MKLVSSDLMRRLDERTIKERGVPSLDLMERAGRGAAEILLEEFRGFLDRGVVVLCGAGNNGGDGYVIARVLSEAGADARVFAFAPTGKLSADARTNRERWEAGGGRVVDIGDWKALAARAEALSAAGLLVDALLGTGLTSGVRGLLREAIQAANASGRPIAAIDIPSGVDATTGEVHAESGTGEEGVAIRAAMTITFGLAKIGLVLYPGAACAGRLRVVDIGIPEDLIEDESPPDSLTELADVSCLVLPRDPAGHKGTYGHVFLIGGSEGKSGAIVLAALGALRSGAGLVTVGAPESLNPVLEVKLTEAMTLPLAETAERTVSEKALEEIADFATGKAAIAIGPGIGLVPETGRAVRELVRSLAQPAVVDADALTLVAEDPSCLRASAGPRILTPHPGEMARLARSTTSEITGNRLESARRFAEHHGVVLVLKGARTIVAGPDGRGYVNPTGNPAMATGGTGDVLTGIIAGLLAQGHGPVEAGRLGVFVHGLAGDRAAELRGPLGCVAGDIVDELPPAFRSIAAASV